MPHDYLYDQCDERGWRELAEYGDELAAVGA